MQWHRFGTGHDGLRLAIDRPLALDYVIERNAEERRAISVRHKDEALEPRPVALVEGHNQIATIDLYQAVGTIDVVPQLDHEICARYRSLTTNGLYRTRPFCAAIKNFDNPSLDTRRRLVHEKDPRHFWWMVRILDHRFPPPRDVGFLPFGMGRVFAKTYAGSKHERPLFAGGDPVKRNVTVHP